MRQWRLQRVLRVLATVAIVATAGGLVALLFAGVYCCGPPVDDLEVHRRAEQHHQSLWEACVRYAREHQGEYPDSLHILVSEGYIDDLWTMYVGRNGVAVEIMYRPPAGDSTDDTIMLCDSHPTYEWLWTRSYVEGNSALDRCFVYATTVGGYQDYVPFDEVRAIMNGPSGGHL